MANMLTSALGRLAGAMRLTPRTKHSAVYVDAIRAYTKLEYGDDWSYAFNYMLENDGNTPKMGMKL